MTAPARALAHDTGAAPIAAPSKTVLMIAYAFPPEAYVGGRRTLKYCKYLGQFGWRPIVLTIAPRAGAWKDERLASQIPASVDVQRTFDVDAADWLERLSNLKRRLLSRRPAASTPATVESSPAVPNDRGPIARIKDTVARLLLHSPDSHVFWLPFAFARGVRLLLTRDIDVVYSSSPPHSSHIVAAVLALCFRKPHVVDLRDPWIGADRIKGWILRRAAAVTVVSPDEPAELAALCPGMDARRISVITNGYDPDDFDAVGQGAGVDSTVITLTHAGTIYRETGEELFVALARLLDARPALHTVLRVNLIGDIDPAHQAAVRALEATGAVRALGCLGHRETLQHLVRSDALLVLARGGTAGRSHIPAKVFEYLFARRPILAVAEEGALTDLLRRSNLGVVVPPRDPELLRRTILTMCGDAWSGELQAQAQPNQRFIRTFERKVLTEKLARVLDAASSGQA